MTKQKKKFGCLKILLIGFLAILALPLAWLSVNFRPLVSDGHPLVDISAETTWITQPLNENGDVDYLEALNVRTSKGVTPANNAAVLYTRAFGPCSLDEELFAQYLKRLKIDGSQVYDNPLVDFDEWFHARNRELQNEIPANSNSSDDALEQYQYLMDDAEPWSPEQFPLVTRWMEEYGEVAQTIRDATKRERCYFPLVARAKPRVMSALLPHAQKMRHAARYFSISALRHLHTKDINKFIEDLRCMEQLAQHTAQGSTVVEELYSISIKRIMLSRAIAVCSLELNVDDLKTVLAFIETIEPLGDAVSRIDYGERIMMLDAAVSGARGESEMPIAYPQAFVDWNETLRVINTERDLLVKKLSGKDHASRTKGSVEMWNRLEQIEEDVVSTEFVTSALLGRKAKARWMGKLLTGRLSPAFDQMLDAETRLKSEIEMTQIAVAISLYRKEKGELPNAVSQLVPEYLASIPVEGATGKQYQMNKMDTVAGFRVQSAAWIEGAEEELKEIMIAPASISFEEFLQER